MISVVEKKIWEYKIDFSLKVTRFEEKFHILLNE